MYIRRPLPELERAGLQLQSPSTFQSWHPPTNSTSDKHAAAIPQYLVILTSIQAPKQPSIPGCMDAFWRSSQRGGTNLPQPATGCNSMPDPAPPPPRLGP